MIFVTVGTAAKGIEFTRLVREADRLAGVLGKDMLIQRGTSDYEPVHAQHVRFLRFDEALEAFRAADLVIGHCGAGTILNALRFGKPAILVPRRLAAGELNKDDHQMQLAAQVADVPGIRVVHEVGDLEAAVRAFLAMPGLKSEPSPRHVGLIEAIRGFLGGA